MLRRACEKEEQDLSRIRKDLKSGKLKVSALLLQSDEELFNEHLELVKDFLREEKRGLKKPQWWEELVEWIIHHGASPPAVKAVLNHQEILPLCLADFEPPEWNSQVANEHSVEKKSYAVIRRALIDTKLLKVPVESKGVCSDLSCFVNWLRSAFQDDFDLTKLPEDKNKWSCSDAVVALYRVSTHGNKLPVHNWPVVDVLMKLAQAWGTKQYVAHVTTSPDLKKLDEAFDTEIKRRSSVGLDEHERKNWIARCCEQIEASLKESSAAKDAQHFVSAIAALKSPPRPDLFVPVAIAFQAQATTVAHSPLSEYFLKYCSGAKGAELLQLLAVKARCIELAIPAPDMAVSQEILDPISQNPHFKDLCEMMKLCDMWSFYGIQLLLADKSALLKEYVQSCQLDIKPAVFEILVTALKEAYTAIRTAPLQDFLSELQRDFPDRIPKDGCDKVAPFEWPLHQGVDGQLLRSSIFRPNDQDPVFKEMAGKFGQYLKSNQPYVDSMKCLDSCLDKLEPIDTNRGHGSEQSIDISNDISAVNDILRDNRAPSSSLYRYLGTVPLAIISAGLVLYCMGYVPAPSDFLGVVLLAIAALFYIGSDNSSWIAALRPLPSDHRPLPPLRRLSVAVLRELTSVPLEYLRNVLQLRSYILRGRRKLFPPSSSEVYYDMNFWRPFIDALFFLKYQSLERRERVSTNTRTLCAATAQQHQHKVIRKSDGTLVVDELELLFIESSLPTDQARRFEDTAKVGNQMKHGLVKLLANWKLRNPQDIQAHGQIRSISDLRVFGIITHGLRIELYEMRWRYSDFFVMIKLHSQDFMCTDNLEEWLRTAQYMLAIEMSLSNMLSQLEKRPEHSATKLEELWKQAHTSTASPSLTPPTPSGKKEAGKGVQKTKPDGGENELRMLTLLKECPHVIRLLDTYLDEKLNRVLVLERHEEFSVHESRSLEEVGRIFDQFFECVAYMHSLGIVHLDLKPANTLWNRMTKSIVVADFDLSVQLSSPTSRCSAWDYQAGTEAFMSPEIRGNLHFNQLADMYSLGVMLAMMLQVFDPLTDSLRERLGVEEIYDYHWAELSENVRMQPRKDRLLAAALRLCLSLTVQNPAGRPSAQQARESAFIEMARDRLQLPLNTVEESIMDSAIVPLSDQSDTSRSSDRSELSEHSETSFQSTTSDKSDRSSSSDGSDRALPCSEQRN